MRSRCHNEESHGTRKQDAIFRWQELQHSSNLPVQPSCCLLCQFVCLFPPPFICFIFYAVLVVSKESMRLVRPCTWDFLCVWSVYDRVVRNTALFNNFYLFYFTISYCRYMFRPLFGHPQTKYTILVIGSYYTHNASVALYSIFITCIIRWDRLRGLVVRVPGYRTEMYCASCEVRTEFIYVM
jgi:hypothetical protein